MENYIFSFFIDAFITYGIDLCLIIAILLQLLFGVIFCLLKVFHKIKNGKANGLFLTLDFSVFLLFFLSLTLSGVDVKVNLFYSALGGVISLILSIIFCLIEKKEKDQELVNLIDREIEKKEPFCVVKKKVIEEKEEPVKEVDFLHVKNVLDRLEYFNLTQTEKKQVKNLKESVYIAEREGITKENRQKINDGLSDLLKIMSRYGV